MHFGTAILILIVALLLLLFALIGAVIAYQQLNTTAVANPNTDINYVQGTLLFFIIVDAVLLLVVMYAIAKVRTSNAGGIAGFIFALLIIVFVLIFGINSINKIDGVQFQFVLQATIYNTIVIPVALFMVVLSVFVKPKLATTNYVQKVITKTAEKMKKVQPDYYQDNVVEEDILLRREVLPSTSTKQVAVSSSTVQPLSGIPATDYNPGYTTDRYSTQSLYSPQVQQPTTIRSRTVQFEQ